MSRKEEEKELARVPEQTVIPPERATAMEKPAVAHSRLPWRVEPQPRSMTGDYQITSIDCYYVCNTIGGLDAERANAEFIVTAVNHHEKLLKALKYARSRLTAAVADVEYIDAVLAKVDAHV